MKKTLLILMAAIAMLPFAAFSRNSGKVAVYGVAFYNLENLFDTINNNPLGRALEFTPTARTFGAAGNTGQRCTSLPMQSRR